MSDGARRWAPAIAAGALVAILLTCGVGGFLYFRPYLSDQYPASLATPAEVAGLTLSTDPLLADAAAQMAVAMNGELSQGTSIAAFYLDPGAEERTVAVWGGTALLRNPEAQLDEAFRAAGANGFPAPDPQPVDPGPPGGAARCGQSEADGLPMTVCGWADHGSLVMLVFFSRDLEESATLLPELRAELRSS